MVWQEVWHPCLYSAVRKKWTPASFQISRAKPNTAQLPNSVTHVNAGGRTSELIRRSAAAVKRAIGVPAPTLEHGE